MTRVRTAAAVGALLVAAGCTSSGSAAGSGSRLHSSTARVSTASSHRAAAHPRARVVATLSTGVSRTVAVNVGGRLLLLGGLAPGDVTTDRVVSVDPKTGHSRVVGALALAVHDAAGGLLGGSPVVFGGGASTETSDVQRWQGGHTAVIGHLPAGRSDSAAAVIAGTAYVVGGFDGTSLVRDILATHDGRSFSVAGHLRQGVRYPAVAAYHGSVWVIGGELATTDGTNGGPETAAIQRFDPASGRTIVVGHLPVQMGHAMAFTLGGSVYVAGGRSAGVARDRIYRIDADGRVTPVGRLPHAESDAAVVEGVSTVWLVGGETSGPAAPLSTVLAVTR